jgi:hypothetical protein
MLYDNFYLPASMTVPVGTTVSWMNRGRVAHTSTNAGVWDTGTLAPGGSASAVFATTGTFNYLCTIHPLEMQGTITVVPAAAAPPAAPGAAPAAAPVSSASMRQQVIEALNRGDATAAAALFTDDGVLQGVAGCFTSPCTGRAAVLAALQREVGDKARITILGTQPVGNTVTGRFQAESDLVRAAGAQRLLGTDTVTLRGDRVASFRIAFDLTDPQTAAAAAQMQRMAGSGSTGSGATASAAAPTASGAPSASATLAEQMTSGVTGSATLSQSGGTTTVMVTLRGLAPNSAHAGHIHRGSCSGAIIFPLATVTANAAGEAAGSATVNAALDTSQWWVQYHASDSPPGAPVTCGQVLAGP